jgi:hypothetical protein
MIILYVIVALLLVVLAGVAPVGPARARPPGGFTRAVAARPRVPSSGQFLAAGPGRRAGAGARAQLRRGCGPRRSGRRR